MDSINCIRVHHFGRCVICLMIMIVGLTNLYAQNILMSECHQLESPNDKISCYQKLLISPYSAEKKEEHVEAFIGQISLYMKLSKYYEADSVLNAMKSWAERKGDSYVQYRYWLVRGDNLIMLKNEKAALEAFSAAEKLHSKVSDHVSSCYLANSLGVLYYKQGSLSEAMKYYQESLSCRYRFKDTIGLARLHKNMGNMYVKGYSDDQFKNHDGATHHWDKAIELYVSIGDTSGGIIDLYYNYAFSDILSTVEARMDLLQKGITIALQTKNMDYLLDAYELMGRLHIVQKQYLDAYEMQIKRNEILSEQNINLKLLLASQSMDRVTQASDSTVQSRVTYIHLIWGSLLCMLLGISGFIYGRKWILREKISGK